MADTPRTIDYSTLRLAVEYADGTRVEGIRVIPSATRAIEAEFNEQFSKVATFDREDWMHTAAWTFLKLREGEDRPFDEWLATVDRLQIVDRCREQLLKAAEVLDEARDDRFG